MIGLPFNNYKCLGSITDAVPELVATRGLVIAEIAAKHRTTADLINCIRGLPQKDDDGDKHDGPKVETCESPQRLPARGGSELRGARGPLAHPWRR